MIKLFDLSLIGISIRLLLYNIYVTLAYYKYSIGQLVKPKFLVIYISINNIIHIISHIFLLQIFNMLYLNKARLYLKKNFILYYCFIKNYINMNNTIKKERERKSILFMETHFHILFNIFYLTSLKYLLKLDIYCNLVFTRTNNRQHSITTHT